MESVNAFIIRRYEERDFPAIHELNKAEGWNNLVEKHEDTKEAWKHSNAAFVAEMEGAVAGCLRGLTDGHITFYIAELLIHPEWRGQGIGKQLLSHVHSLYPKTRFELLASQTSRSFYEALGYRAFYGFRKTIEE
ncbi:GNAT family N-acetyltransferase [Planococcus shenhongbingii]|uniref:GNAT family N-acetyltransferase n=1 Tax=Planococcus shenhongbingii TaxID=3058398 RepID=A0ABT8NBV6_9BACL|nr:MULTISPECIES: GNAT family N-acetyltransferase [unclassified Planococcus (in: firmicutes)]MDN7245364.1 GNAT family N-acetyltransferase [Planococcus sp. N017]WKA58468.1 GNAT family N-acetyltransferase [Planococcus sp. N016]